MRGPRRNPQEKAMPITAWGGELMIHCRMDNRQKASHRPPLPC
ncbi:hypothetical protein GBAR_LOCUS28614 [Geodia barretti]|uniref:Uncharacterized protein n=1 Tax=Geodia barretti TaxID=519541 RepID=A0AA35XB82_GEOBA|nr:hypothetical protein GBAR_LOCUS28614 [Geodia barretti]